MRSGGRSLRRIAANGSLFALSVCAALLLAEVAVRFVAPQQLIQVRPDIWQPVDSLGWIKRPGVNTTVNIGDRTVLLITDDRGFRIGSRPRPVGGIRILLLGDSFMEALQVEYEESLAGLLETKLSERLGIPVEVWNTGVSGWDPVQYLLQARSILERDSIDLVIVALYAGNDAVPMRHDRIPPRQPNVYHKLRSPKTLKWDELIDSILYPINDFFERRSHLYLFLKTRMQTVLMRLGLTATYFPVEFLRSERESDRWQITGSICRDIAEAATRSRTQALFVIIPTQFQVDTLVFNRYVRGFNIEPSDIDIDQPSRLLRETLEKEGLLVIDALPALRAAHSSGQILYGSVDPHMNAAGHALLAELVVPRAVMLLKKGNQIEGRRGLTRRPLGPPLAKTP